MNSEKTVTTLATLIWLAIVVWGVYYWCAKPRPRLPSGEIYPRITGTSYIGSAASGTADVAVAHSGGVPEWNTPRSTFGRWVNRAFRVVKTPEGYVAEMNQSEHFEPQPSNAPAWWIVATVKPRDTAEWAWNDVRIGLAVKKEVCDAFDGLNLDSGIKAATANGTNILREGMGTSTWAAVTTVRTNLPTGWKIMKSNLGKYRWIDDFPSEDCFSYSSEQGAVDAAWSQYEFRERKKYEKWEVVR